MSEIYNINIYGKIFKIFFDPNRDANNPTDWGDWDLVNFKINDIYKFRSSFLIEENVAKNFINIINKGVIKQPKSYKTNIKKIFSIYYISKKVHILIKKRKVLTYSIRFNMSLKTLTFKVLNNGLGFYIYLGAYKNSIYTVYDFTMKYYPNKKNVVEALKSKIEIIEEIEEIVKESDIFANRMLNKINYAKKNN